jgi:FtsP/CotA-like multicopper oxidase with cupredoxin domain
MVWDVLARAQMLRLQLSLSFRANGKYSTLPFAIFEQRLCRYRFRLINMACFPNYIFSIDGHSMTIIEVDGANHQPLVVDSIQIFVAQRYSFIVSPPFVFRCQPLDII